MITGAIGAVLVAAGAFISVTIAVTGTGIATAIVLGFVAAFCVLAGTVLLGLVIATVIDRRSIREHIAQAAACGEDGDPCACSPTDDEIEQWVGKWRKESGRG